MPRGEPRVDESAEVRLLGLSVCRQTARCASRSSSCGCPLSPGGIARRNAPFGLSSADLDEYPLWRSITPTRRAELASCKRRTTDSTSRVPVATLPTSQLGEPKLTSHHHGSDHSTSRVAVAPLRQHSLGQDERSPRHRNDPTHLQKLTFGSRFTTHSARRLLPTDPTGDSLGR